MLLQDMINAINRRVDDIVNNNDAVEWLNAGQNDLGIRLGASFPQLDGTNMSSTFVFPAKYHEIPVLYACAMYKTQDTSLQEAQNFLQLYEERIKQMVLTYDIPPAYRDDANTQQFTATAGQTTFTITEDSYDPSYGNLKVYQNGQLVPSEMVTINTIEADGVTTNLDQYQFILPVGCALNDFITAVWEEHADMEQAPYPWMSW